MMIDVDGPPESRPHDLTRRTVVKAAAWTLPVIAVAVAAPLAAASPVTTLSYAVAAPAAEDAPYGSSAVLVTNGTAQTYSGPLTFRTPVWATASLSIAGAAASVEGSTAVWTIPDATIPAHQTVPFPITWARPYPESAEHQPLSLTADPTVASTVPAGDVQLRSAYQLLWTAVTPGGQGSTAGTPSFFIANTTESELASAATVARMETWGFPLPSVVPVTVNGVRFSGTRALENGQFVSRYDNVPTPVAAGGGKVLFTFLWNTGGTQTAQQSRKLISVIPDSGTALPMLGSPIVWSWYRQQ